VKKFTARMIVLAAILATPHPASTQPAYPTRPITVFVPYTAGSPTDTVARVLAERMKGSLGQPILIENPNSASAGIATIDYRLIAAFIQKQTGTQFALVPYRGGGAPAVQDLIAGQIDLLFSGPAQLPLMRAGSIKAYAVTSDTRSALAPDIPTFAENSSKPTGRRVW
jgi:tripartite-type tricarboxylate transporter receptor subunit TctC